MQQQKEQKLRCSSRRSLDAAAEGACRGSGLLPEVWVSCPETCPDSCVYLHCQLMQKDTAARGSLPRPWKVAGDGAGLAGGKSRSRRHAEGGVEAGAGGMLKVNEEQEWEELEREQEQEGC